VIPKKTGKNGYVIPVIVNQIKSKNELRVIYVAYIYDDAHWWAKARTGSARSILAMGLMEAGVVRWWSGQESCNLRAGRELEVASGQSELLKYYARRAGPVFHIAMGVVGLKWS
jgi:hypothetical protein